MITQPQFLDGKQHEVDTWLLMGGPRQLTDETSKLKLCIAIVKALYGQSFVQTKHCMTVPGYKIAQPTRLPSLQECHHLENKIAQLQDGASLSLANWSSLQVCIVILIVYQKICIIIAVAEISIHEKRDNLKKVIK